MQTKRVFVRFLIFALGGMLGEVFYTALLQGWSGNLNVHGQSSPWMMIDYGLLGVILMPIATPLKKWGLPLAARAFVYMLLIYLVSYSRGASDCGCGVTRAFPITFTDKSCYTRRRSGMHWDW